MAIGYMRELALFVYLLNYIDLIWFSASGHKNYCRLPITLSFSARFYENHFSQNRSKIIVKTEFTESAESLR
jgi:hypothetical protein